jgi:hypothetical protein
MPSGPEAGNVGPNFMPLNPTARRPVIADDSDSLPVLRGPVPGRADEHHRPQYPTPSFVKERIAAEAAGRRAGAAAA